LALASALAKELVALQPDVILAHATSAAVALHRQTSTIPVVFASVGNPIGFGLIASLARPGGNFTGLTTYEASIAGKWLAMLKEIAPSIRLAHESALRSFGAGCHSGYRLSANLSASPASCRPRSHA
jgi:ABC-type uncharacterized transport system substrate-binding protein